MNANELADAIRGCGDCSYNEDAYIMLRQQQSEIAELKHMNRNWQISENILLLELEKLQHCELTDEEITAIWYQPTLRYDPVAFARAILRKASEK